MPKYWLDFTGAMADGVVLHCYFRSGDPTYYESWFILDLYTADITDDEIAEMARKCSSNDTVTQGQFKVLKAADMACIYTMASGRE